MKIIMKIEKKNGISKNEEMEWNEMKCVLYSPRIYHLLPGQEPWSRLTYYN